MKGDIEGRLYEWLANGRCSSDEMYDHTQVFVEAYLLLDSPLSTLNICICTVLIILHIKIP